MNNRFVKLLDPNYAAQMNNGTQAGGLAYLASQLTQGLEMGRQRKEEETAKQNDQAAIDRFISGFQGQTQMRDGGGSTPAMAPGGYSNAQGGYAGALDALKGVEGPRARELMLTALQGQQQTQAQRAAQERADRQRQEDIDRQNRQWEASYGLDQRRLDLAAQPKQTPETFGSTPVQVMDPNTGKPTMVLVGNRGTIRPLGYQAAPEPAFAGTGIEAQDRNALIQYKLMMDSGQPIDPQMEMAAKMAYGRLSQGSTQTLPDGSMVYIPGADLAGMGLANPGQQQPQPVNGMPRFDPSMIDGRKRDPLSPQAQTVFDEGKQVIDGVPIQSGSPSLEALLAVQERNQQQAAPFMQQQAPQSMPQQADAIPGVPGSRVISPPKPVSRTEGQSNAALYADRMDEANAILSDPKLLEPMTSMGERTMGAIPGVGNYMVSDEYQMAQQAQRNFVNAVLRRESGAVISDEEFKNAAQQYFPQPGDSPAVVAQKAQNRMTAIAGIRRASGPGGEQQPNAQQSQEDPLGILGGGTKGGPDLSSLGG